MAKPKLALIPAAQGTSLYSVLPSSGVGDFQFNRSGSATSINSQGLIETVASGVSRLNYPMIDGVVKGCPHHILEPASTNLVLESNNFNNYFTKINSASVQSNQVISPDGTLNADKIIRGSADLSLRRNSQVATGTEYTFSIYAKKGTASSIRLDIGDEGMTTFNLTDYWQRFNVKATPTSYGHIDIEIPNANQGDYIYVFGAMVEQNSFPTSYIPTTSAPVTRSAETATGSGDAVTFNDSEGVLMAEVSKDKGTQYSLISLQKSSVSDTYAYIGYLNNNTTIRGQIKVGGTTVLDEEIEMSDTSIVAKILIKYKSGDYSMWVNGFEVGSNTNSTIFSDGDLNEIEFGYNNNSSFRFYGKTKQLQYFDTTDIDLEQLTSWVSFTDMAEGQLYTIE